MDGAGEDASARPPILDLCSLKALSVLGRGAKGVVFLVRHRTSSETLALKAISKSFVEKKKPGDRFRRVRFELETLRQLRHPLLPRLRGFVITDKILGTAMDYCAGGDLYSLMKKQAGKVFSEDVIRFYAAELVLALEYLHSLEIVYRDLKPENILVQETGHLMLVDFDLSRKLWPRRPVSDQNIVSRKSGKSGHRSRFMAFFLCRSGFPAKNAVHSSKSDQSPSEKSRTCGSETESKSRSNSFVGTQDYVAPEIISGTGHDFAVDWWSLGVVLYEMLYGRLPFRGINRKETFYRVLTKSPALDGESTPLKDLIGRLLEKDPEKRPSLENIKGHEFFQGVDWENLVQNSTPPIIPGCREEMESDGNRNIDIEDLVERVFYDSGIGVGEKKSLQKDDRMDANAPRDCTKISGDFSIF